MPVGHSVTCHNTETTLANKKSELENATKLKLNKN